MKRTTFSREQPDPIKEAINDVLHWSWSFRLQVRRLTKSLRAEFNAWNNRPGVARERRFSATSYDEHMLVVAGGNLDRAIRKVRRPVKQAIRISTDSYRALWLLRHNYEHWDELRRSYRQHPTQFRGAAAKLKKEFPRADLWSLTFNPADGEIVLADVVPLTPLVKELRELEKALVRLKKERG